jgi:hypothetical protein
MRRARGLLVVAITLSLFLELSAVAAQAKGTKPAALTATTTTSPYTFTKTEAFGTASWWKTWGLTAAPWHTSVVTEDGNPFLRVGFPAGSHNGTAFSLPTDTSDAAHIRYRVRFSPNWQSQGGKLPGFGNPVVDSNGVCLGGCGLMPADGITSWSGRSHYDANLGLGTYLYVPDKSEWVIQWGNVRLVPGQWYTIEYAVQMNTPGQNDGVLTASIDGQQLLNATNMNFRSVSTLHVGKAWFDFYYGGTAVPSQTMWVDVDDITVDW